MDQLGGDIGHVAHADKRHVLLEKVRAARDVRESQLAAVLVLGIVERAHIAAVVEEGGDDAQAEHGRVERFDAQSRALVAVDQARHRERHVAYVLDVVVRGIAGMESRQSAGVERGRVAKCLVDLAGRGFGVELEEYSNDLGVDRGRVRGVNAVRYVVFVAAASHSTTPPEANANADEFTWFSFSQRL